MVYTERVTIISSGLLMWPNSSATVLTVHKSTFRF